MTHQRDAPKRHTETLNLKWNDKHVFIMKGITLMRYLNQFLDFRLSEFMEDKTLISVGVSDLVDYNADKKIIGCKISSVIYKDDTLYSRPDDDTSSNVFEKLSIKVPGKKLNIPNNVEIKLPDTATAVVYGEYRNQLSITSPDGVIVVNKKTPSNATTRTEATTLPAKRIM